MKIINAWRGTTLSFDFQHGDFYYCFVVTVCLKCTVFPIWE